MIITVENILRLEDIPENFRREIKKQLTTVNPLYEEAVAFRRFTRGIPRYIKLYVDDKYLGVPRGFYDEIQRQSIGYNISPEVVDNLPNPARINPVSKIKLWDYQERFVSEIYRRGSGIGVSPPGSGKTVSALELICRHKLRTLWVTHTSVLAKQTCERIEKFIDNVSIGHIGTGKWVLGDITVALVQTLCRRDLSSIAKEFPLIIVDECFPAGTVVSGKEIQNIKVGEYIISFDENTQTFSKKRVADIFRRIPAALIRICFNNRSITCTPNHPIYTRTGWKPAVLLSNEDEILLVSEDSNAIFMYNMWERNKTKFSNASRGTRALLSGPHLGASENSWKTKDNELQKLWKRSNSCYYGRKTSFLRSKRVLFGKMWERIYGPYQIGNYVKNKSDICVGTNEEEQSDEHSRNEKACIKHAERDGTQSAESGRKRPPPSNTTRKSFHRHYKSNIFCVGNGAPNNYGHAARKWLPNVLQIGHRLSRTPIGHRSRWEKSLSDISTGPGQKKGRFSEWSRVDSIEVLEQTSDGTFGGLCPDGFVYNIKVEGTQTYTANGVVVHNCHHTPSTTFTEVLLQFWAKHFVGLSATPYRKDGLENIMTQVLGPIVSTIEKRELIEKGRVIPATIIQKHTGIHISDRLEEYSDIVEFLYDSERRIEIIAGDVVAEASIGNICIVLASTIDYGRRIVDKINSFGVPADLVFTTEVVREGRKLKNITMPRKEREQLINGFVNNNGHVLVVTFKLLSEGFDHQPLNRVFLASPVSPKNRTLLEQICGRAERVFPGKEDAVVFDYVDDHSLLTTQARKRALVYGENLMEVITDKSLTY